MSHSACFHLASLLGKTCRNYSKSRPSVPCSPVWVYGYQGVWGRDLVSGRVLPHIFLCWRATSQIGTVIWCSVNWICRKQMLRSSKHSHPSQLAQCLFPPFSVIFPPLIDLLWYTRQKGGIRSVKSCRVQLFSDFFFFFAPWFVCFCLLLWGDLDLQFPCFLSLSFYSQLTYPPPPPTYTFNTTHTHTHRSCTCSGAHPQVFSTGRNMT